MPSEHDQRGGYSPHMNKVALSILVMGVSLAVIILLWVWVGRIGPSFSTERMLDQQAELRQMYGLPPEPSIPENQLKIPPSLRNITHVNTR